MSLYGRLYGLSAIALRLGQRLRAAAGPPAARQGWSPSSAAPCSAEARRGCSATARQTRDYIYVDDVVEAFLAAAASEVPGTYNVGTGVETCVLELGELLGRICDREFDPEMAPARFGEVQRIAIDSARAASDLGWRARTGLDEGLRVTAASFR